MACWSRESWLDVQAGVGVGDTVVDCLPGGAGAVLLDLHGDQDYKLVVADLGDDNTGPKLKAFRGATLVSEVPLPERGGPVVGVAVQGAGREVPLLVVALPGELLVYRHLRLLQQHRLPPLPLDPSEAAVWTQICSGHCGKEEMSSLAERLRGVPYAHLTPESQRLLSTPAEILHEVARGARMPVGRACSVSCMTTLSTHEAAPAPAPALPPACLVLATDAGDVLLLHPHTYRALRHSKVCSGARSAHQVVASGHYDLHYRITVATRERSVCVLEGAGGGGGGAAAGEDTGRVLCRTACAICQVVVQRDLSTLVLCADGALLCYTAKGVKQWSVSVGVGVGVGAGVAGLVQLPLAHVGRALLCVALRSGQLHLYSGKARLDTLHVPEGVSAVQFGALGREEHVLAIVTASGNLNIKILKRTARASLESGAAGAHEAGEGATGAGVGAVGVGSSGPPWALPKKSRLFLEQTARERQHAPEMHASLQRALAWVRVRAAAELVRARRCADVTRAAGQYEPLTLTAQVEGSGPVYVVRLWVEWRAAGAGAAGAGAGVALLYRQHRRYRVSPPYIPVPWLAAGARVLLTSRVEEIQGAGPALGAELGGEGSTLRVLVLGGRRRPLLGARLTLPPSVAVLPAPGTLHTTRDTAQQA